LIDGLPFRVVTCIECGLGQLDPHPDADALAAFYPPEYYGVAGAKFEPLIEWFVRWVGARHVGLLVHDLPVGARILDVGCGRGVLLSSLADRGYEAHGFEISDTAVEGVDPRTQIRVAAELAEASYPDGHFDEVILWHVLEHLPSPRETLEEIQRILKPGGRLVVSVPNFSSAQARWFGAAWFHLDLPRHLYHFPAAALQRLLDECGFERRSVHHFSLRQNPFGWVQSALNQVKSLPRNGLYTLLKRNGRPGGAPYSARIRFVQRLAYLLGMPLGLAASVLASFFRSGASVAIIATRREQVEGSDNRPAAVSQVEA
jgi:SAM-dependent methyltransferase